MISGLGTYGIAKAIGVIVLAVCLFLPWFQMSFDQLIDMANAQSSSYSSMAVPKLGGLGYSVLGLGDLLNECGKISNWLQQTMQMSGSSSSSSEYAMMSGISSAGGAALPYRVFGLLWIASIILVAIGAFASFQKNGDDKLLRIGAGAAGCTAIIGIIVAVVAGSQISSALGSMVATMGSSSMSSMAASMNLFGFTPAPFVAIVAAIVVAGASFLDQQVK